MSSLSSLPGASGKLLRRIHRACRPTLDEPNIALNLEICDLINQKQGNLPREACVAVAKLINSRDPQVSELALTLLDYLVKNCGYPVHLQISRKEFLNELVKRFPERPPPAYSRVQRLILGTLAEWVQTICKTSRYKEDLGYVRDMYRLLRTKGYDFPAVKREDAAVLNPSDNLKSIEELQREERFAQSAKLQELIRRGRPQDLKEANDLMKIMSGFKEDESLEETKQKVHDDLDKLGRKIDLLDEMLNNATNSGKLDRNDETLDDLISTVKVSQPRVQQIIQEEQGSNDVAALLSLNDRINAILTKIGFLEQGDAARASQVKSISGSNAPASMNLIDFDDDEPTPQSNLSSDVPTTNDAIADLLGDLGGLTFESAGSYTNPSSSYGIGAINLLSTPEPQMQTKPMSNLDILSGFNSPTASVQYSTQQESLPYPNKISSPPNSTVNPKLDPFQFDFNQTSSVAQEDSQQTQLLHSSKNVTINYIINQKSPELSVTFLFSNNTHKQLSNVQFSLAVTKTFELNLQAASGLNLLSGAFNGIKQTAIIRSKKVEAFNSVKLKFKCDYVVDGAPVSETGVATISF